VLVDGHRQTTWRGPRPRNSLRSQMGSVEQEGFSSSGKKDRKKRPSEKHRPAGARDRPRDDWSKARARAPCNAHDFVTGLGARTAATHRLIGGRDGIQLSPASGSSAGVVFSSLLP